MIFQEWSHRPIWTCNIEAHMGLSPSEETTSMCLETCGPYSSSASASPSLGPPTHSKQSEPEIRSIPNDSPATTITGADHPTRRDQTRPGGRGGRAAAAMAGGGAHGGTTYKGYTIPHNKRWHTVAGKGLCAVMWYVHTCSLLPRSPFPNPQPFRRAPPILAAPSSDLRLPAGFSRRADLLE